jgi:hypothetical protein
VGWERALAGDAGGVRVLLCMESARVCEAIAAAAFCAQRIGGSPKRRSVLADGAPTGSRCRCGRPRPATNRRLPQTRGGSVWPFSPARRRAAGRVGRSGLRVRGCSRGGRVLEVDDLPDRFPAGLSDAVDDATHLVDLEGDVPEPRTVCGRRQLLSAGGRRVERTTSNMSLPSGARAITISTVTFSRPMIRSIHSPLNTPYRFRPRLSAHRAPGDGPPDAHLGRAAVGARRRHRRLFRRDRSRRPWRSDRAPGLGSAAVEAAAGPASGARLRGRDRARAGSGHPRRSPLAPPLANVRPAAPRRGPAGRAAAAGSNGQPGRRPRRPLRHPRAGRAGPRAGGGGRYDARVAPLRPSRRASCRSPQAPSGSTSSASTTGSRSRATTAAAS